MSSIVQVFTLVGENTVRRYKADVVEEVEPQINELISRAQKGMHALQTRQNLMQDKVKDDGVYLTCISDYG